jgi:hypothetical protein
MAAGLYQNAASNYVPDPQGILQQLLAAILTGELLGEAEYEVLTWRAVASILLIFPVS